MDSKKYIFILIMLIGGYTLCAFDTVDLCEVPWTDATRFEAWDKKIKHSKSSVCYNLSGKALSFSSTLAVNDKSSSVNIIILVDRKEAFRKTIFRKDKTIPVSIDLKNKQQIELLVKYGKGSFEQIFMNPKLEVKNKKRFLETSREWRKKVELEKKRLPEYPKAPKWKNFKIEKKNYKDWDNSYFISNGKIQIVISPEFGGRIMSFKLVGGRNILAESDSLISGGHFNRPQPQNYFLPCDPLLTSGKYDITFPVEGEILLTSPKSWKFYLQYKFRIKLSSDKPELEISNIHKNIASFQNMAGIWSITRVNSKLATALMLPEETKNPRFKYFFNPEKFHSFVKKRKQWNKLDLTERFWMTLKNGVIEWKEYPATKQMKLVFPNMTFIKSFDYIPERDDKFMGKFYPSHFFIYKLFIEAECHGSIRTLAPGKEIILNEKWKLLETTSP